jgi:hypothetical protein
MRGRPLLKGDPRTRSISHLGAEATRVTFQRRRTVALPFDQQCRLAGLPIPQAEWRFHATRRWRFDWAFIETSNRLAVEVEGGAFIGGRHTRGAGFLKDLEKYAEATVLGWRILRVTPKQIANGEALNWCDRTLRGTAT